PRLGVPSVRLVGHRVLVLFRQPELGVREPVALLLTEGRHGGSSGCRAQVYPSRGLRRLAPFAAGRLQRRVESITPVPGGAFRRPGSPGAACAPRGRGPRDGRGPGLAIGRVDEAEDLAGLLVDPIVLVLDAVWALDADVGL